MPSTFCWKYIERPSEFCWYFHHTFTADPGFSFSSFAATWLVSTRLSCDCSLFKKRGLSKVLDFSRRGKWQPNFLMIKTMMTVPMATAVMTSTTVKVTWPLAWGSTAGFTVQIQNIYDEPEELNCYCETCKNLEIYQLLVVFEVLLERKEQRNFTKLFTPKYQN